MYVSNNGRFKEGIIWWDTEMDPSADVDVFFYIHDFEGRARYKYGFKTLEIDLTKTMDQIWSEFKPNLRNELRKAQTMGFEVKFLTNPTDEEINLFVSNYNGFADFKKLQHTSVEMMTQLRNDGKLNFSLIYKDGELLVAHSHYVSGERTRLYHSYSTNNSLSSKDVAFANKLLTEQDIQFYKNQNLKVYDFGGIGNVEGDNSRFEGIIQFKKQFGGQEVVLWKGVTPNGERGEAVYAKYWK